MEMLPKVRRAQAVRKRLRQVLVMPELPGNAGEVWCQISEKATEHAVHFRVPTAMEATISVLLELRSPWSSPEGLCFDPQPWNYTSRKQQCCFMYKGWIQKLRYY